MSVQLSGDLAGSVRWAIVPYVPRPPFRIYAGQEREPVVVADAETLIRGVRKGDAELTYLGPAKARPVLILNEPARSDLQEVTALRLLRLSKTAEYDRERIRQQADPLLFYLEPARFALPEESAVIVSALVTLHVAAISREQPAGSLNANELRELGERIITFYGFDYRLLVERTIHELVRRRQEEEH